MEAKFSRTNRLLRKISRLSPYSYHLVILVVLVLRFFVGILSSLIKCVLKMYQSYC